MHSLLLALTLYAAEPDPRRTPVVVAVEAATPAVVTIRAEVPQSGPFLMDVGRSGSSMGSGVIIDASGLVLTNAHVVLGARRLEVTLSDGRVFPAEIVAADAGLDLAVLKVQGAARLPTIALGDSDDLLLGEPAVAIGNPYGLGLTVSTGVVASVKRDVAAGRGPTQTYIQTDAAINPGNSGGALVNIHGELIGINTFVHSAGEGIGFAIPVNRARKIADDLRVYGSVQVPWLGVDLQDVPPARVPGVPTEGAAMVTRVAERGPADRGGVRVGDAVVEVSGHRVATRSDTNARLAERAPGGDVQLVVIREGAPVRLSLTTTRPPGDLGRRALTEALQIRVDTQGGRLVVVEAGGEGSWVRARLVVGDAIIAVDGQRVTDPTQLERILGEARAKHRGWAWFTVERGSYRGTLEVAI